MQRRNTSSVVLESGGTRRRSTWSTGRASGVPSYVVTFSGFPAATGLARRALGGDGGLPREFLLPRASDEFEDLRFTRNQIEPS